jgi:uncharacterized membrane protein
MKFNTLALIFFLTFLCLFNISFNTKLEKKVEKSKIAKLKDVSPSESASKSSPTKEKSKMNKSTAVHAPHNSNYLKNAKNSDLKTNSKTYSNLNSSSKQQKSIII